MVGPAPPSWNAAFTSPVPPPTCQHAAVQVYLLAMFILPIVETRADFHAAQAMTQDARSIHPPAD
jgi:hypothetical protein